MSHFFQLRQKLEEKTLTAAEKKKREEVAKAIKREHPGMPMAKKMAIATATAKKVAEEKSYTGKGNHRPGWMLKADPELAKKFKEKREAYKARVKAYGNPAAGKSVKEESEQIDELKKSTVTSYINKVVDPVYGIPKGGKESIKKRLAGLTRAHQRIVGHKPMTKEEVEQVEEAQFWGNKEMAKQANAASGSTTTMRGRDAKGTYTATLERKKGESEHKEVSRKYDTKSESFAQQFNAMVREKRPEAKLTNSIEKRKETEELIKKRQASGVKHSMFVPPHNKYPINSRFD